MSRKLAFEVASQAKGYTGFAVDPEHGDVVAKMSITKPREKVPSSPEDLNFQMQDPGGQLRLPIFQERSKVSWALANAQGRRSAAPHMLAAAMTEHFNVSPVADEHLSPEGARMAKSAVRRGLLKPHPGNPTMEATEPIMFGNVPEMAEKGISRSLTEDYQDVYAGQGRKWTVPETLSDEQMSRAHKKVFGTRKPYQRPTQPEGQQGSLF